MQPKTTAWIVCLIPLLTVHLCWLWSSLVGSIPFCFPYWTGCTSISRAARLSDALFLFRAGMIFSAGYLMLYWYYSSLYISQKCWSQRQSRFILGLGYTGALFLILYADFLGTEGKVYRLMRQYGVIFYFTFTVLAQMLFTRQLWHHRNEMEDSLTYIKSMLYLGIIVLIVGFTSLWATATLENPAKDKWENLTEWWFALTMTVYFGLTAKIWEKECFCAKTEVLRSPK